MRILFCNKFRFAFSGTEVYLLELEEMLRARGHEVAWFAMEGAPGAATNDSSHFVPTVDFAKGNGHKTWREQLRLAARVIYYRGARKRLGALVKEFRPDVAHARNIYHHLSPSILWELRAWGVPIIYHLNDYKLICPSYNMIARGKPCEKCRGGKFWHAAVEGCHKSGCAGGVVLATEAYVHKWLGTYRKCADRFVVPSHFARAKLFENGWEEERIEVLPHFQRIETGESRADRGDGEYILYFGRLSEEKGVGDLLKAMERLPAARLVVAGEGPEREDLQGFAAKHALLDVKFVGRAERNELKRLIDGSRFTVLPSRAFETFGKAILESYAQGRAVVASDCGPRRELVEEGRTGLLFGPGDVRDLAEKIRYLWERPDAAREMGEAGRQLAAERFSPEEHYERLMGIYTEVIEARKARRRYGSDSCLRNAIQGEKTFN